MEITFLGTSSMVPTKERNHSGILLEYKGEGILLDCGEGTQRQLKMLGIAPNKVSKILISHWHGDHVLGVPGLLQTIGSMHYEHNIKIYGPKGTKRRYSNMGKVFLFEDRIEVEANDVKGEKVVETEDYIIEALQLEHTTPCVGYNFIEKDKRRIKKEVLKKMGVPDGPHLGRLQDGETIKWGGKTITPEEATYTIKGKKITYIADTKMCANAIKLAKEADLLICEATYANKLEEKALQYKHLTAGQAGFIATKAEVKKLIITHFSQRYKDTDELKEDVKIAFQNSTCASDFMKVKI